MMKRKLSMLTMAVLLLTAAACSSDEPGGDGDAALLPIRLSSSVGAVTRSNDATNLLSGDTVYVWADMVNGATQAVTEYFNAWALKANGVGSLSTLAAGNAKLFPATNALNFYALVGNFGKKTVEEQQVPQIEPETTEFPATGVVHTVLSDQKDAEAYYKSDLLYAVRKNQEPVSEAVVLPFKHLLSRIQVVIVAGNGMTAGDLTDATVELLNLKRQVTFSPDKAKDFSSQTDLASMLNIPSWAAQSDIVMKTAVVSAVDDATSTASASVYADAIVVPQTVSAGQFIHVRYLDRDTYYRFDESFTVESGKQYRFRLIADRIGARYEQQVEIADWTPIAREEKWVE